MGILFLALLICCLCFLTLGVLLLLVNRRRGKRDSIAPAVLLLSGVILALICALCFI